MNIINENNKMSYLSCEYMDGSEELYTSFEKIVNYDQVIKLKCCWLGLKELPELPFNLQELNCNFNQLTVLPKLPNTLKVLLCIHNQLTELSELPNGIERVECSANKIKRLPKLPNTLERFDCWKNELIELPTIPKSMKELRFQDNQIDKIPISILNCKFDFFMYHNNPIEKKINNMLYEVFSITNNCSIEKNLFNHQLPLDISI